MSGGSPLWRFGQCFGEKDADEEFSDADVLSAVEFDDTGTFLATGDKGGRIVVFQRADSGRYSGSGDGRGGAVEYKFYTEFQSHEAEFDFLKSLEIEEKINQIAWCKGSNGAHFLLSSNDKTIKLWKIYEKQLKVVSSMNVELGRYGGPVPVSSLKIPSLACAETTVVATPRRVYANAHAYHVNSISVNADGETYMSADDLRINLWNMENSKVTFNIIDIKPTNMEDLVEVITAACFHPTSDSSLIYSSSRGSIKLADMRARALCDAHAQVFEEEEDPASKSYFSEIIASISDVKFTGDGKYIVSRDYLTVKVWDTAMNSKPVYTLPIHEHLRPKLCDLYESDCIFDKFEIALNGSGTEILTGSYHNAFSIYDKEGRTEVTMELSKVRPRPAAPRSFGSRVAARDFDVDALDFSRKVLHFAWHPREPIIAIAGLNNLYIYNATA